MSVLRVQIDFAALFAYLYVKSLSGFRHREFVSDHDVDHLLDFFIGQGTGEAFAVICADIVLPLQLVRWIDYVVQRT